MKKGVNSSFELNNQGDTKIVKRLRRLAATLFGLGVALVVFQSVMPDYMCSLFMPDGIYIPHPTQKFSKQDAKGGVFSHTFRIYNLRPRWLQVKAEPNCGCTGVSWDQTRIPPLGWIDLTASVKAQTTNLQGPHSVGIAIRTSSFKRKWLFVFLEA